MPDSNFEGLVLQWLEPSELKQSTPAEFATLLHAISHTTMSNIALRGILSCLLHVADSEKLKQQFWLNVNEPQDDWKRSLSMEAMMQSMFVATLRRCGETDEEWLKENFSSAKDFKLQKPQAPRVYLSTWLRSIADGNINPHPIWDDQHILDLALRYEPDNCSPFDDEEYQMVREAALQKLQQTAA